MLSPKKTRLFNYFTSNYRPITVAELLIKFKKIGDHDFILNLLCSLEEFGLITEDPQTHAWTVSDYGRLIKGSSFERLIRA
jgi:hypothetical protein